MIDKLAGALNFYQQALQLRHQRQGVLAGNIANADTPHFKARDFNFSDELARAVAGSEQARALHLTTTSERHFPSGTAGISSEQVDLLYRVPDQPSLDGNTVNMDVERVQFADNSVRYQAALTMINSRIQSLKGAMQSE
ncbi:protein FlgB2 [Alcanivorax xiamenensis]|uniref:Flagellar basal body rod protein FlgB n=1 Tax=Alcanivorax xiamenensis TaxID=1177156 RepID=A0ABQ6Y4F5_9GAMM|nr:MULTISPECIES: flagellar basal body rod protein FlgB [Alcanivorax]KAF0804096.1 protein FlgB2 [Alcanivorax xiamenensis]